MAHQAIIDFTMASGHATEATATKAAHDAGVFFTNGFDLLAANWSVAGILKNEVMAHPENYQSWVNLGSRLAGGHIAGEIGASQVGGGLQFKAISIGSGQLANAFESDAVIRALGKDGSTALAAPCRIVSLGCATMTDMFTGLVKVGINAAIDTGVGLTGLTNDILHGRNANANAQKFGEGLLQYNTGMHSGDVKAAGSDFGNMWGDIFSGGSGSKDGAAFGNDLQKLLYSNNTYMQAAEAAIRGSAGPISNAAQNLAGAIVGVGHTVGNGIVGAANTVAQTFSSY
jgi:hypothetical protein